MNIKFFQYLLNRKNENGFTLIELLVVVITIGILFAIALPSFLGCGNTKAISSEAKYSVVAMNRIQQVYFSEKGNFSNSFSLLKLELGIKEQTQYFNYSIISTSKAAFNYGIARQKYTDNWLNPKPIKTFVGAVFAVPVIGKNERETLSITCESKELTTNRPANPSLKNGIPSCGEGTINIEKKQQ